MMIIGGLVLVIGAFYFLVYAPEKRAMAEDATRGIPPEPFNFPFNLIFGGGSKMSPEQEEEKAAMYGHTGGYY